MRLLVAGTASGVGKHTVTCTLLRLLRERIGGLTPFKPFAIEQFPLTAAGYITPSIQIQAVAAGLIPHPAMNPIRVLYSRRANRLPKLLVRGKVSPLSLLDDSHFVVREIAGALTDLSAPNTSLIIEGTGALSDWVGSPIGHCVVTERVTRIVLVTDSSNGGGLASVVGTLELLPAAWRTKIAGVVFNQLGEGERIIELDRWRTHLSTRYHVPVVAHLRKVLACHTISENQWPVRDRAELESAIEYIALAAESSLISLCDALQAGIAESPFRNSSALSPG